MYFFRKITDVSAVMLNHEKYFSNTMKYVIAYANICVLTGFRTYSLHNHKKLNQYFSLLKIHLDLVELDTN